MTTERPTIEVGDFFYSSWGYDQTNITFFKVLEVSKTGKTMIVQEWQGSRSYNEDRIVPGNGPKTGCWVERDGEQTYDHDAPYPPMRKTIRYGGYKGASFNWTSYANGYLWDGAPKYVTPVGMGH